ncbi:putative outer membrane protein (plasmid) [Borreliella afzelii PKo]|uniref:Outer membrane protein n=1 Tax=Borreliella afzelii (strain PKo) TaxID=390236 RepID=Q0SLV6_BORAP|nr:outer membrane protein [Borreliella afzelii PKo]AEL70668.1 putative outer membrane protein [Borreliella afzelii PKo]
MSQFKLILIFVLFIVSATYATVTRPFDFKKWNFKKDIDLAYVLMYDIDNGILIKSQDKAGNIKSQEILAKLNKLNVYSNSLHKTIKKRLARRRFQKEVEFPLLKIVRKYKYLTKNYKNKRFIENPEYTKLIVERSIKKVLFLENYFQSKFKNVKFRKKIKKRIDANQSSLKSLKGKTNSPVGSKFSKSKTPKRLQGLKKCNKKRILNKYNLNKVYDEYKDEPESSTSDEPESSTSDEPESSAPDELDSEIPDDEPESSAPYELNGKTSDDEPESSDSDEDSQYNGFNEETESEDEFFDLQEDQFN